MNASITTWLGLVYVVCMVMSGRAAAHGLISDPPSRNAHCGMNERADQAVTPACVEAAEFDAMGMYSYMSVLTHDVGRQGLTSENVCGFDSETWQGGPTPWDLPLDWPATAVQSGPFTFTWDISMGPHFDDTEEFVYYITRPEFLYQAGHPLTWNDFEEEPFCLLKYDDARPSANPDVLADKLEALFHTRCQLPERSGRHVIYGEWGRNYFTFERFHGCVDVRFDPAGPGNVPPTGQPSTGSGDTPAADGSQEPETVSAAGTLSPLPLLFSMLWFALSYTRVNRGRIDGTG